MNDMTFEVILPFAILGLALLFVLIIYLRRRVDRSFYSFDWRPALFETFLRRKSLYDDVPRRRRGPDMAFSAGRDPAHQNTRLRQVFIPMPPEHDATLRQFYLGELGLMEMRAPNAHLEQDGFWAITGTRQVYFGTMPDFPVDRSELPTFSVEDLRGASERLAALGYETMLDRSNPYVDRLIVTDPIGNEVGLIER
ncbi:hypothetical protein [Yoonia sp. BS5-3]|uniref:VOC domain-containing protein n=1 Tax=Yoonia phaeophyticola TaxID=3137369 RepID=A0ABZ2V905_9RHOB